MNHKYHETFYSTCSLKQIIRRILTSDQPLQRLWKVNTFSIFISFFFGNFVTLKKNSEWWLVLSSWRTWYTWLHGFVCHTNKTGVIMLTLNHQSNPILSLSHEKIYESSLSVSISGKVQNPFSVTKPNG